MLCSLFRICSVYSFDCFVNEERFIYNHVIILMCFELFCAFAGKAVYCV